MTKDEAFLEWYKNAHWGNEDLKECCHRSWNAAIKQARSAQAQEPVAWTNWRELAGARHYRTPGWEMYADKRNPDDVALYITPPAQPALMQEPVAFNAGVPPLYPEMKDGETISVEYTTPPASQRPWVGLTDEDSQDVIQRAMHSITGGDNTFTLSANKIWVAIVREVEAKLKEKNNVN